MAMILPSMKEIALSEPVLSFGSFELLPTQRMLLQAGKPVRLGSRALDILVALTRSAGDVVGKDELIAHVWPGLHVEEANLRVHVAALRKALGGGNAGNHFIANIPGRGYAFVAPIAERQQAPEYATSGAGVATPSAAVRTLPTLMTRVIGRADVVETLIAQLPQQRFVTIVGAGGIGKTTVAIAVAEGVAPSCADGVAFVDLAPISDHASLVGTVASAIGLEQRVNGCSSSLAAALRTKAMLLVLDNCEHLPGPVAELAETLLKAGPSLILLATSREALRAEGEWVQRLRPLDLPPASTTLTAAEALRFPAVQLFAERAASRLGGLDLADADAPVVGEICRRLDGIALAIEFAAGRVDAFELHELAALLDDRFQLLTRGRRTALPRHQTLRATLDWSYGILLEPEQAILRRLSVFSGTFTLAAAQDVVMRDPSPDDLEFGDGLTALVAKSLVTAEVGGIEPQYRLLETTRAYAREKLEECGEAAEFTRRHAEYHRELFERAEKEWERRPTKQWLAEYIGKIDELRVALKWAFTPGGDAMLGVALTVAALPLWFQLSLVDECLDWVGRALASIDPAATDPVVRRRRMQLSAAAPGWLNMYSRTRRERGTTDWMTALEIAEELGDVEFQMRALWALWGYRIEHGEFRQSLHLAERFCDLAATAADPSDQLVGERMAGASLHFLGDQAAARQRIDCMLVRYVPPVRRSHSVRFQFDQQIAARITRARILWLQGYPDRALSEVEEIVEQARTLEHTLTLGSCLVQTVCPVVLLAGDLPAAGRYTGMLRDAAAAHRIDIWGSFADGFMGEILVRQGEVAAGLPLLGAAVDVLQQTRFSQFLTAFLAAFAQGLAVAGRLGESLDVVDGAIARLDQTGERWALPELLRIRGEACAKGVVKHPPREAEAAFQEALRVARAQEVPSWELRAATSLAGLWQKQDRIREAIAILAPVHARFTEGFGTADLVDAGALLEELDAGISRTALGGKVRAG